MDSICPPLRWNMVEIGISRGAYPLLRNFRHLSRMRLKTIVSLIPEPPSADLVEFAKMANIELVYIQTNRTGPMTSSLQQCLVLALNVCINQDRHPVYLHCLDGRRIAGLVVLYIRRMQGWTPISAIAEYWRFQTAMRPTVPSNEIEKVSRELEKFASEFGEVIIPENIPSWLWGAEKYRNSAVSGVKFKFIPPLKNLQADTSQGNAGPTGFNGETPAQEQDRLAYAYLSSIEQDADRMLRLGPGATKALHILRSHSNTPMHIAHKDGIRGNKQSTGVTGLGGVGQQIPHALGDHPLLQSIISRTLDALCLPGLESYSSRPFRKKSYNIPKNGPGGLSDAERVRMSRATVSGTAGMEHRSRSTGRLADCYYPLGDQDGDGDGDRD